MSTSFSVDLSNGYELHDRSSSALDKRGGVEGVSYLLLSDIVESKAFVSEFLPLSFLLALVCLQLLLLLFLLPESYLSHLLPSDIVESKAFVSEFLPLSFLLALVCLQLLLLLFLLPESYLSHLLPFTVYCLRQLLFSSFHTSIYTI